AEYRTNNRVPRDTRPRRRRDDATFAGNYARDVSRRGTYARHDDLRHRNDGRACHRPDSWWMDNLDLQLALEFLHQRSGGFSRGDNGVRICTRPTLSECPTPGRQGGLPWDHSDYGRPRDLPNRSRPRGSWWLVRRAMGQVRRYGVGGIDHSPDCS